MLLLCEHASYFMPAHYQHLGVADADRQRHIAWDLGAAATAELLSQHLDAPLVCATQSRLLLDLNRSVDAADSIVVHSEDTPIPGNVGLSAAERQHRQQAIYQPFHAEVDALIAERRAASLPTAVISIHSFTPCYRDVVRPWHVGVLSQYDRRLAAALLAILVENAQLCVGDNQPYAPGDGVYHSVERHGEANALPCVMLEIRNDLIADAAGQQHWARLLHRAVDRALGRLSPISGSLPYPADSPHTLPQPGIAS